MNTEDQNDIETKIVRAYKEGLTILQCADAYQVRYNKARNILNRHGVLRTPGARKADGSQPARYLIPAAFENQFKEYIADLAVATLKQSTQWSYRREIRRFLYWAGQNAPEALSAPAEFAEAAKTFIIEMPPAYGKPGARNALRDFGQRLKLLQGDPVIAPFESALQKYASHLDSRGVSEGRRSGNLRKVKKFLRWAHEAGIDPAENWAKAVNRYLSGFSNDVYVIDCRSALTDCGVRAGLMTSPASIGSEGEVSL